MRPSLVKMCAVFFVLMLFTATAWAFQGPAGIVETLTGKVYIHRNDTLIRVEAKMPVWEKDTLVTKKNAYAGIVFTDGTVITIGPESIFEMSAFVFEPAEDLYDFSFYMEKGSAIYNSGKIGRLSPDSVKMTTPKATVGVRGTRFVINL
ncbi:MAG: FecR family protein [Desulfotignum sp.]|nr:FecR family protein [Desulfotignum sp.]MCF8113263.1 FecR family protein [Desulfotignum sp.]MCF8124850.1 FecR family protein [Desulfotignum sp.]